MRYDCLRKLLQSALNFYPDIPVVVADDTPDSEYQSINVTEFPNARQYKMPGHSGGALAISQVETEYFIWFDDDFQEGILTVAHSFSHSSDHSSGKVGFDNHVTNFQQKTRFYIERNKDGFCSDRRPTPYHVKIPEYQ